MCSSRCAAIVVPIGPVNLVAISMVADVTTIAAFKVYGEVLFHPDQISASFENRVLTLIAAESFAACQP